MTPVTTRPAIDIDALIGPEEDYQRSPQHARLSPLDEDILLTLGGTEPMDLDTAIGRLHGTPDRTVVEECLRELCADGYVDAGEGAAAGTWTRTAKGMVALEHPEAVPSHFDPHELQAC